MPKRSRTPTLRYESHTADGRPASTAEIFTYTLNRIKPGQLLVLAVYSYALVQGCKRDWITPSKLSKLGAAIVGVLSMVTGLLLSYRFSSALSRWDEGKKVWVALRSDIRDGIRMLSMPIDIALVKSTPRSVSGSTSDSSPVHVPQDLNSDTEAPTGTKKEDLMFQRTQELCGLLVSYAFALQHHLHGTRPLPQPPLSDLLPSAYLSSLRRTEARVRFAESHAPPSAPESEATIATVPEEGNRPGLRRRSTGPKPNIDGSGNEDEWELSDLRSKAEEAVEKLSKAVANAGTGDDLEFRQQLHQLNLPLDDSPARPSSTGTSTTTTSKGVQERRRKSNLCAPYPPNMPLALLKLMESYLIGLAEVPKEKGGWAEAKRERGLNLVKSLSGHLGDAERLSSTPPPLPLTVHLTDLLRIYLAAIPPSLMCVANGWTLVFMSVIAGWCFLGLEALISDVGGVFGHSENHHPLPRYASEILHESLDLSPSFMRYYRSRLIVSRGEDDASVQELDRRNRKGWGEEWMPSFE